MKQKDLYHLSMSRKCNMVILLASAMIFISLFGCNDLRKTAPVKKTAVSLKTATSTPVQNRVVDGNGDSPTDYTVKVPIEKLAVLSTIATLTPVQTRIVNGNGDSPTDYAIKVGSNTYKAPAFPAGLPAYGFHVVVLDRASLTLKANKSFHSTAKLFSFLKPRPKATEIIILSSLQKPWNPPPPTQEFFLYEAVTLLGGTVGAVILTANDAYSLIGVRGFGPGQAQELNNAINQGSDANIKGAFTLDTGGTNQTFVAQDAVTFSIKSDASALKSTIQIGANSWKSKPAGPNAIGGFQVLVLNRTSLATIYSNTFWTNQTNPSVAYAEIKTMIDMLVINNNGNTGTENVLVFLSSIGKSPLSSVLLRPILLNIISYQELTNFLSKYGGNWTVIPELAGNTGHYTLVGAMDPPPEFGLPAFRAIEVSSVTTPASPAGITGALLRDRRGLYGSGGWDPSGSLVYELFPLAYQTPLGHWPFGTKDANATAGQKKAYEYISSCVAGSCGDPTATNLRSRYPRAGKAEVGSWSGLLPKYPGATACDFSKKEFATVFGQVHLEILYMTHLVDNFGTAGKIALLNSHGASNIPIYATCVESMLMKGLQPPPGSKIAIDVFGVLSSIAQIAGAGAISATLRLAMSTTTLSDGSPGGQIFAKTADLSAEVKQQFTQLWKALTLQYQLIASDWPKLQAVGKNYVPKVKPEWEFADLDKVLTGLDISLQREFYRGLLTAGRYRVLDTGTVLTPDAYKSIRGYSCTPFKTWPEQAVFSPHSQVLSTEFNNFVLVELEPTGSYGCPTPCGRFITPPNPSFKAVVNSLFTPSDLPPPGNTCTAQNLGLTPAEVFIKWPLEHISCTPSE